MTDEEDSLAHIWPYFDGRQIDDAIGTLKANAQQARQAVTDKKKDVEFWVGETGTSSSSPPSLQHS